MRLPRPYTPVDVRLAVIERQVRERFGYCPETPSTRSNKMLRLGALLNLMFGDQEVELHHRPALCNRQVVWDPKFRYIPDANDPEFLIYVSKEDHRIETRVRGLHGQHSDLGLLRKNKRILRKRQQKLDPPEATAKWFKKAKWKWPKPKGGYKWPKRKLRSSRSGLSRGRQSSSRRSSSHTR